MKIRLLFPLALFLLAAQDSPPLAILSPWPGDVLFGAISVIGTTDVVNFASAQLDFKYASESGESAGTWFLLQTFSQPARETPLYLWDTIAITDGRYILRLRVTLTDGTVQEVTVPVTILNDSPLPSPTPEFTSTPEPAISIQLPTPFLLAASPTPTDLPRPTPTALPANPAALDRMIVLSSLGRGALVILGLFLFSAFLFRLRRT